MPDKILLTLMHLNDAPRLRQAGIEPAGTGSLAALRDHMRRTQDLCGHQVWLANGEDGGVLAIAGVQIIDPAYGRAMLHLQFPSATANEEVLRTILRKAFYDLDLYRLELPVAAETGPLELVLRKMGWHPEGVLRNAVFDSQNQRHHDVVLCSILRPDFDETATVYIPFSKGVFAISGNNSQLLGTDFIRFGDHFRHDSHREAAEQIGLLDAAGRLLKRTNFSQFLAGRPYLAQDGAPDLLVQAALQAAAYFAGQRTSFDLPLDLEQGSEFQKRVWRKLPDIPFGTTWTYEELAYNLEGYDWTAARKMSRAVGSACGANPFPLLLPCHRVIGKDGKLVGFSSGLDIKEYLLAHEMMGLNE
jgi:O-6-methylguanine DNA methyltransferase